ncbi:HopJ type III effector protein [Marinomonas pollencensis]|uniref:HopJ type III effector protein n=1 Tax=Marinomonas pollencensis TaxID=491954 RepID=A0A3E0DVA8_9GAMM|nr:HopJ type III effector protein [Marinomonas pollencensis]REG86464.1 HopJ type III effector protein [Marinomonas pollencensis]
MLTSNTLLTKLKATPQDVQFKDVIDVIEAEYDFTPVAFTNGQQANAANENNGSCKIFSFAALYQLTEAETLALFGDFYRLDVLENPTANDHQNIRQFMISGWQGISFDAPALSKKA